MTTGPLLPVLGVTRNLRIQKSPIPFGKHGTLPTGATTMPSSSTYVIRVVVTDEIGGRARAAVRQVTNIAMRIAFEDPITAGLHLENVEVSEVIEP